VQLDEPLRQRQAKAGPLALPDPGFGMTEFPRSVGNPPGLILQKSAATFSASSSRTSDVLLWSLP
jgi:hypothetical protein